MIIDTQDFYKRGDRRQKSLKKDFLWLAWLDWVEYLTQWVWNVHLSLKWQTWVKNGETNIEKCSIKMWKMCHENHVWIEN